MLDFRRMLEPALNGQPQHKRSQTAEVDIVHQPIEKLGHSYTTPNLARGCQGRTNSGIEQQERQAETLIGEVLAASEGYKLQRAEPYQHEHEKAESTYLGAGAN
jgi:hypothetical protein